MQLFPNTDCHRSDRGFTLIEVMISMMVVLGVAYLVSSTLLSYRAHRVMSSERELAMGAVSGMAMELQSLGKTANVDPDLWAATLAAEFAPGGPTGPTFPVQGLSALDGFAEVGSIVFVTDETLTDAELGTSMGMPRDLNGDGDSTDLDVSLDAQLIPVMLRLNWSGAIGENQLIHGLYLSKDQR